MRLNMKCKDITCNIRVDSIEKVDDVIFAYKKPQGGIAATEFVGMFDLGSVDYLYLTDEKQIETRG